MPFEKFYVREAYNLNYVKLHPNEWYVGGVSIPRCEKAMKKNRINEGIKSLIAKDYFIMNDLIPNSRLNKINTIS